MQTVQQLRRELVAILWQGALLSVVVVGLFLGGFYAWYQVTWEQDQPWEEAVRDWYRPRMMLERWIRFRRIHLDSLYWIVHVRLDKGPIVLEGDPTDALYASEGAGSTDIFYRSMTYDCSDGDITIEGKVPDAEYWQFGVYDRWVRDLEGGHLNNRTIRTQGGRFTLRITQDPQGKHNVLDCRGATQGILIYRVALSHTEPETPTVSTS